MYVNVVACLIIIIIIIKEANHAGRYIQNIILTFSPAGAESDSNPNNNNILIIMVKKWLKLVNQFV